MSIDQLFVTGAGVLSIAFIYWFFFMKTEKITNVEQEVEILVDGGYSPEAVSVPVGKEVNLIFFRKDPSSCLEEVILSDFGIRRYLPLNERVAIAIRPTEKKSYTYSCGMNMFHGKVIAR